MSKRLVAFLVLAALALTAFSFALSRRDSQDWRANRSRRLFPFPWQEATRMAIRRPDGDSLLFERRPGGEWRLRLAGDLSDTLSYRAVDEMTALATLAWREPLRDSVPFNPATATTLTATAADGQTVTLALGGAANNIRAVAIDGDIDTLYGVNQDLLKFVDWPGDRLRNLNLTAGPTGARPRKITLAPLGRDDLRIVMERSGDEWTQVEPVVWPVDGARLDLLLRWLDRLRADSIEAEFSGDLEWFGFGDKSTCVEVEYDAPGGILRRRVLFGKPTDGEKVYVRVDGRQPVFSAPAEALAEISLNVADRYPELWRNFYRRRGLNILGREVPSSITVERLLPEPITLTLEQVRERDSVRWRGRLEAAGATREFAVDPPDPSEAMRPLTALLTGLSSFRVKAFLADRAPGDYTDKWTKHPAWRFTAKGPLGDALPVLTIYAADGDGRLPSGQPYAEGTPGPVELTPLPEMPEKVGMAFSVGDRRAVMEAFGDLSYLLCLPPYRYQSRRLVESNPAAWTRVEVAVDGDLRRYTSNPNEVNEQWWLETDGKSEPLMDDNNQFVSLLLELSQLKADGYVAESRHGEDGTEDEFGLDRPLITAIVYVAPGGGVGDGPGKQLFKLSLGGSPDADGKQRYALLNDSGPVFLIPGRLAEALLREYR